MSAHRASRSRSRPVNSRLTFPVLIVGGIAHPTAKGGALLVVRGRVLQRQYPPDKIQGVLGLLIDGRPQAVAVALPFPTEGRLTGR